MQVLVTLLPATDEASHLKQMTGGRLRAFHPRLLRRAIHGWIHGRMSSCIPAPAAL